MSDKKSTVGQYLSRFFSSDFALCVFVYCVFFLFFFRAQFALSMFKGSDEFYYLRWMESLFGNDYRQLPGDTGDIENHMAMGTSIFWLPSGAIGHLVAMFLPGDAAEWVGSIVAFYSSFLWTLGLYLIWKTGEAIGLFSTDSFPSRKGRLGLSLLTYLNIPVLFFGFQRPLMAHTTEVLFSWLVLLLVLRKRFTYACIAGAFLSIVRYNDAVVFLLILGAVLDSTPEKNSVASWKKYFTSEKLAWISLFTVVAAVICVFYVAFISGYGGLTLPDLLRDYSSQNLKSFFVGLDWGVLWLLPVWCTAFVLGILEFRRLSWMTRMAWLWVFSEAVICICWGSFGGSFGRRYLIGSYVGVFLILFEVTRFRVTLRKPIFILISIGALWLTYLTTAYRTVPNISFHTNPKYMLDMLRSVFHPDFYLYTFLHSPIGVYYKNKINLVADPVQYSMHPSEEALSAMWVMTAAVIVYAIVYVFYRRKRSAEK